MLEKNDRIRDYTGRCCRIGREICYLEKAWKGAGWIVDEVEPGFASNDKDLQNQIELYWYFKNLCEFSDLENDLHKENEIMDAMAKDLRELHWHWSNH